MENNKNKKSVKFQGDVLNFCDFIKVFVFTRNHHLKPTTTNQPTGSEMVLDRLSKPGRPSNLDSSRAGDGWVVRWCWVNFQC